MSINFTENDFSCLYQRSIIDILIGDTKFEELEDVNIAMPYLTANNIIDIGFKFGLFEERIIESRWLIMTKLLQGAIKQYKIQDILSYLFDLKQFKNSLKQIQDKDKIIETHKLIISKIIEAINEELWFNKKSLIIAHNRFYIKHANTEIVLDAPAIKLINKQYITDLKERTKQDIDVENFDSAITKARTLIEEVLIYILEEKKVLDIPKSGDIIKLNTKVKEILNMQQSNDKDKRINTMLSGLEKILQAIAEMRNAQSDAHGAGSKRINIRQHEAQLVVNSAITISEYILSVHNYQKLAKQPTK